jgi:hypothetical protein
MIEEWVGLQLVPWLPILENVSANTSESSGATKCYAGPQVDRSAIPDGKSPLVVDRRCQVDIPTFDTNHVSSPCLPFSRVPKPGIAGDTI